MDIAIMIEGQDGLNWDRWQRIALLVDEIGFAGLYRSDHYTNANPPDKDSLELWVSLTWLADNTQDLEFGPLVSPVSFRHPTMTARMAAAVDDLSQGRLILGMGAGWQQREHEMFGWELLDIDRRFQRFEEGLNIVSRLLKYDHPSSFSGDFYRIENAVLLPRPARPGGPPLLVGGNGIKRTLPLVARYADEWNGVYLSPSDFASRSKILDDLLIENDRQTSDVRRSLMAGTVYGKDEQEVNRKVAQRFGGERTPAELRKEGILAGTIPQILSLLAEFERNGVERIMLQWLELDNTEGLEDFGRGVLPHFS